MQIIEIPRAGFIDPQFKYFFILCGSGDNYPGTQSHDQGKEGYSHRFCQLVHWILLSPTFATRPQKYFFYGNGIT